MANYFIRETINTPYEKTVIEHKAPTDDSVRLYEEIKNKAYKSILGTIEVHDNLLNVTGIVYRELASYKIKCMYVVTLNGKEIKGEVILKEFYSRNEDRFKVFEAIVEDVSRYIAVELLKSFKEEDISWLQ